jgi:ribosomal protein L29
MAKKEDYKKKTDGDLIKLLIEKNDALRKFRFGIAGTKTRNVKEAKSLRKVIARIKTEQRSRK